MLENTQGASEELLAKLTSQQNRLQAYIFTLTADREATSDILQAVNLVIWRKASDFIPGSNFTAWAFQICRYQVMAYRQKMARERVLFSEEFITELADSMEAQEACDVFEARRAALASCLETIPTNKRQIIWLHYRDGLRLRDIAQRVGKSTNAVEQILSRMRGALLQCIARRLKQEALP